MKSMRIGAWACVVIGVAALGWSAGPLPVPTLTPAAALAAKTRARLPRDSAADVQRTIAARDVFRAARQPAGMAYDPQAAIAPAVSAPAVPKPTLALVGVIGGDDPTAVIDGLPGVEGSRVVRIGDVVGGLVVRRIANGDVRITGMDTVWVLKVRETWR